MAWNIILDGNHGLMLPMVTSLAFTYKQRKISIYRNKPRVLLAMYWSFATMTTVAYGDITPMNPIEIVVAQFAMIGAVFFFAFNI